jgi:hypothetical protein
MDHDLLGAALRAWRGRVRPEDVGVPYRGARRTPGLRRDEVAMLAGVSVEYVIRLEQGRARHLVPGRSRRGGSQLVRGPGRP